MSRDLDYLQVKYGRPRVLSDPFSDNTSTDLCKLLAKPNAELRWGDYKTLLGPHLPAGTYEEIAYFVPLAFDCIRTETTAALELCSSIVWFSSQFKERLTADKVCDSVRAQLLGLLRLWTSAFKVVHFDRSMCLEKGWVKLQYFDLVETRETVCQMLCDLVEYSANADLADRFIVELINFSKDPVKAAWLLELLRARDDVYHPPPSQRLELASADHTLLFAAYQLARTKAEIGECSPTYWCDTTARLGMR